MKAEKSDKIMGQTMMKKYVVMYTKPKDTKKKLF